MAVLTKSGARKPIAQNLDMGMSGGFPVDKSGGFIDLTITDQEREYNEKGYSEEARQPKRHIYRWKLTHRETIRVAIFAAQIATDQSQFDNGIYQVDRRSSWQALRDLADKLEAEAAEAVKKMKGE